MSAMSGQQVERAFVPVSTNTTVGITHHNAILLVTASTGIVTITAPAASTMPNGFQVTVVRAAGSSYNVQVSGGYSQTLTAADPQRSIVCDGSALWSMLGGGAGGGGGTPDAHASSHAIGAADTVFPTGTGLQGLRRNAANSALEFADTPTGGGNWALSSLVTLSANQTTNLAVGQPIRFDTISGDHTLQNHRVKVKGGQKAELIGKVSADYSGSSWVMFRFYDVTNSAWVGVSGIFLPVTATSNSCPVCETNALVTPLVDTEYELRVENLNSQTVSTVWAGTRILVHSTLPNASVTSQVIKKETVATNTTAWTVTLPVACKAIRIRLVTVNASASQNIVNFSVNGISSGYSQSNNAIGTSVTGSGGAGTVMAAPLGNLTDVSEGHVTVTPNETYFKFLRALKNNSTSLYDASNSGFISQTADISSITFTGSQTNGIGAGSYIIVERVDADLAQGVAPSAGAVWTSRASAANNLWWSVCWASDIRLFVAVSDTGTGNRVMTSPDGITWTSRTSASDQLWYSVCRAPSLGLFVAVGAYDTGSAVMTSPDGITWTSRTAAANNRWFSVCWSPELSLFVAVSDDGVGNRVMTSPDGITWTSRTSAADNAWYSVCWSPYRGIFVAVSADGTSNRVMTSPDGITWTSRTSAADNQWNAVCWAPDARMFVAVSQTGTGNRVMTSPDGITWTSRTSAADNSWQAVCRAPEAGLFLAVASTGTGNRVMTSTDGVTWTTQPSAADNDWLSVCWSPELGIFAATAQTGTGNRVMTSAATTLPYAAITEHADKVTGVHGIVSPPASASSSGSVGQIAYDANYIYRCTATNTWKRVAIATW